MAYDQIKLSGFPGPYLIPFGARKGPPSTHANYEIGKNPRS